MQSEHRIDTGCHEIVTDADGLFTHPLRCAPGRRKIADIISEPAGFNNLGGRQENPAIVHTRAQVQDRRYTDRLTHFRQTGAAVYGRAFGRQQTFHGAGDAVAAGCQNDNIIFDQFLDNLNMGFIVPGSGIVAADHAGDTPDAAVDDVVIERIVGAAKCSAKMVFD